MELIILAAVVILFTLLVIKLALETNELVLETGGNFCKTTSPVSLTLKNLVPDCNVGGL